MRGIGKLECLHDANFCFLIGSVSLDKFKSLDVFKNFYFLCFHHFKVNFYRLGQKFLHWTKPKDHASKVFLFCLQCEDMTK